MNKCFYELELNNKYKYGKSYINNEKYVNRADSYQSVFIDFVKFNNILIFEEKYYDIIEDKFSLFIERNNIYGKRLNNIRKNCEIYEIYNKNIMNIFYNEIKNEIECKLLSLEEVELLNNNYKKHLNKNYNYEKKEDDEQKIEKFKFRDYQNETIQKYKGETGILSFATGLGKTITALGLIHKYFIIIKKNTNNICYWITRRIDILKTQKEDFETLKEIFNFNIIDNISSKNTEKLNNLIDNNKINIILINIGSLDKIKNLILPDLCIYDECHGITGEQIYNYLKMLKNNNKTIIGLSATPIKIRNNNSSDRIKEIFGNNDKIYFLGMITYIDAIDMGLIVPLKLKWINNIINSGTLTEKEQIERLFNNSKKQIEKAIQNNKKSIFWTNRIYESEVLYKCLKNHFKENEINIYLSNSISDKQLQNITSFVKNNNKSILVCVDRFKEGSNDKTLSCGIYFSYVRKQEEHVFIQQIGRLTRVSKDKQYAEYYQLLDDKDIFEKESYIINNIIRYIEELIDNFDNLLIEQKNRKIIFKGKKTGKIILEADFNNNKELNEININKIMNEIKYYNKKIDYDIFCNLLKENNIRNNTYELYYKNNKNLNLPENIFNTFPLFSWNIIYNDDFYDEKTTISKLYDLYEELKEYILENMLDENEILIEYRKIDNKIPNILPWLYYGLRTQDIFIEYFQS